MVNRKLHQSFWIIFGLPRGSQQVPRRVLAAHRIASLPWADSALKPMLPKYRRAINTVFHEQPCVCVFMGVSPAEFNTELTALLLLLATEYKKLQI